MQHAQYSIAPSHGLDYYHPYSTVHDTYFATGGDNFHSTSFSRGSSSLVYPHEDYRYMNTSTLTDRGGPSSANTIAALSSATYAPSIRSTTATINTITSFDATGLAFPNSHNNVTPTSVSGSGGNEYCHPEELPASYERNNTTQGWQWECRSTTGLHPFSHSHPQTLTHPQLLPSLPNSTTGGSTHDPQFLGQTSTIKSGAVTVGIQSRNQNYYPLRSPTAQLPTPAAMAVLLNPSGHGREQTPQNATSATLDVVRATPQAQQQQLPHHRPHPPSMMPISTSVADPALVPDILSREKKHACTMCHKRFDRPSTLRKHLLVHTGEKAFVCETCGRRFGVASNLNRHVRRCILKPVNAAAVAAITSSSPFTPGGSAIPIALMSTDREVSSPSCTVAKQVVPKRGRGASSASSSTGSTSSPPSSSSSSPTSSRRGGCANAKEGTTPSNTRGSNTTQQQPKRRRRAPSPSLWIPDSLRAFKLTTNNNEEYFRVTPVPLPPVKRCLPREERDSWDENVSGRPYHPVGWKGVLPGPGLGQGVGLGGRDVRNVSWNGRGGGVLGRVMVC